MTNNASHLLRTFPARTQLSMRHANHGHLCPASGTISTICIELMRDSVDVCRIVSSHLFDIRISMTKRPNNHPDRVR